MAIRIIDFTFNRSNLREKNINKKVAFQFEYRYLINIHIKWKKLPSNSNSQIVFCKSPITEEPTWKLWHKLPWKMLFLNFSFKYSYTQWQLIFTFIYLMLWRMPQHAVGSQEDNISKSVLYFFHACPGDRTHVIRFGSKYLFIHWAIFQAALILLNITEYISHFICFEESVKRFSR